MPPAAETKCNDLSAALVSALKSGHRADLESAANNIHVWGFGRGIPDAVRNSLSFWNDLEAALNAFADTQDDEIYQCADPLAKLLKHKRVGIATASKWVCFVDEKRFAIFDSRVSIA